MLKTETNEINQTKIEIIRSEISRDWIYSKRNPSISRTFCSGKQQKFDKPKAWSLPPIDFTPKLYFQPRKNLNISTAAQGEKTNDTTFYDENKQKKIENRTFDHEPIIENSKFTTHFRIDSANTDRRKKLKTGFHDKENYHELEIRHFSKDIHRHVRWYIIIRMFIST